MVTEKRPDVLLLNLQMPDLDGIGIGRRIAKAAPHTRMVYMAASHDEQLMREAFSLGARAYLLRDCDFKELVFAIKKVAKGDYYLTGPAGREMVMEFVNPKDKRSKKDGLLTRRETELCRLLAQGLSTKEAAARLHISIKTAETHRAAAMKKLNAKNVTDIVKYCIRNKIISI
jgi:DNA-binding NarL/FixJ family response regulator